MEEGDADWERAHLIGWELCGGKRFLLVESALDRVGISGGERHRLGESALDKVGVVWGSGMPTWRERI